MKATHHSDGSISLRVAPETLNEIHQALLSAAVRYLHLADLDEGAVADIYRRFAMSAAQLAAQLPGTGEGGGA